MTEYKLHTRARVERPDNRGKASPEPVSVALGLEIGVSRKLHTFHLTAVDALELAESLIVAANMVRRAP